MDRRTRQPIPARAVTAVASVALLFAVLPHGASAAATLTCEELPGLKVPATEIGLPTGGAEVAQTSTEGEGDDAWCRADVVVHPVDPTAPDIRVAIGFPVGWTGTAVMFGGGGYNGGVPSPSDIVPYGDGDAPLARDMVVYGSDSGHEAKATSVPSLDGSFASNEEALNNFAGDALKKTHDTAEYLIRAHYGRPLVDSYFAGGSTGGREALAVAQKWPADFNGVISAYPAHQAATLDLFFGFVARELATPGAFPTTDQQALVHRSVLAACDHLDGATDGLISNERGCTFDPATLRCPVGAVGAGCLSDAQIAALKAVSSRFDLGYRTASGETGYPGFPVLSGAQMTSPLVGFGTTPPTNPVLPTAAYSAQFWDQWVRYFVTGDPSYDALSLDPRNPGEWKPRIQELTSLQDHNDADLRPFFSRGGKLLLVHSMADSIVSYRSTVEYYDRVRQESGDALSRASSRLYLVAGAEHANIGGDFSAGWDSLTVLDNWVKQGSAPGPQTVVDKSQLHPRTRPLCEYTHYARYTGSGDLNDASSFTCEVAAADVTPRAQPDPTAPGGSTPGPAGDSRVREAPTDEGLAATGPEARVAWLGLAAIAITIFLRRRGTASGPARGR